MKATCIKWDADGNEELLPTEIDLPDELTNGEIDYDGIEDYLSNKTGFCHYGYVLESQLVA